MQTQAPGGNLFGQSTSSGFLGGQAPPLQSSGFGGGFGQNTSQVGQGGFGSALAQQTSAPGFGMQAQPVQNGFGSTSAFGGGSAFPQQQPQSGFFGQSTQASTGFGGLAAQQKPAFGGQSSFQGAPNSLQLGQGQGGFSQGQQLFGGQPQQPQTPAFGQQQTQVQGGMFGQQMNNFQGNLMGAQQQPMTMMSGQSGGIYSEPQFYQQQTGTINRMFTGKSASSLETDGKQQTLHFTSIRIEDDLSRPSTQMLRHYDMKQMRGTPQQNYEFLAMQEYNQNQQRYPHFHKVQQLLSGNKLASQNPPQQSTLQFGQSAYAAAQPNTWGQPTQQPQQTQLYGGQQQQQNSSTLFGGQGIAGAFAQQQKPLGQQSTLFGGGTGTQQNAFGQQSQPFGGLSAAPTQPLGTSTLFGQQTLTQGAQGIFGQNQQAQNTLFSQQPPQQQPPQPTNLFGSGAQPQQQPSLQFGQQQQQPQQNSLFGGAGQQQQQQSSLFGAKPTTPAINVGLGAQSTLFGAQAQTPSLFGNNQPTQQPQQTSLFGAKPAGSSLFPPAPQPAGSSLFGQQQPTLQFGQQNQPLWGGQQPQQQAQQFNQPQGGQVDLYNSHDPLGLNQFLSHSRPMEDYQKEIDELKRRIDAKYPAPAADSSDLSVIYQQSVPHLNVTLQYLDPSLNQIYQEEALRQRAKQAAKLEQMRKSQLNAKKGIQNSITTPPINLYKSETQPQTAQILKPDLSVRRDPLSKTTMSSDTIRVTLRYQHKRQEYYNERVEIHKSRETGDLLKKAFFWLSREFNYDGPSDNVKIYFNEQLLDQNKPLKDVGIDEDCVINVCLQNSQPLISQIVLDDDEPSEELLPKAPKEGYQCSPSMADLRKMTVKELENVKNFTVSNQFGSILWTGKTDVTRVDLADIVTIIQNNAEVYDDERHGSTKPAVGQKLNKEAIITLTGIKPGQSATKKEQNLKRNIEASDAEHLSYDCVNFEWQFKVKHFTKYGASPDDDEEMDSTAPLPAQPKPVPQPKTTAPKQQSIFETQQKMPPTTQMIMDDSELMLSEINSVAKFKNQQSQKRFHIETPSQQQPIIVQKLEIPIEIPYKSNEVPNKVLEKIKERVKLFSQAASANTRRPSNLETLKYLNQIGVKSIKNTSLGRGSVPKPSFHPKGHGILFTQGRTISLQSISRIEAFPIKDVLQRHLQFHQASNIQSQLQGLQLEQSEDFEMIESSSEANPFQDEFMRSLLQTELPQAKLFTSQNQINAFLQDLARHYATFCGQDKKLAHEFYVVCMLNALYGDPTQQLNQLHRSQRGPDYKFQPLDIGQLNESSLSMQKRRRNAATEVMRLFCQSENPVNKQLSASAKEQEVHETALEFLQIGDVRSAVQLLNKFKQTKLSLLVSQSVSNEFAQYYIGSVTMQGSAQKIVDFISGKANMQKWEQQILYSLMFKEPHHKTLADIVSEIQIKSQSLLWKLLRAYSQALNADAVIQEMRGELTPAHEIRDYRLRWLTHLVLHSAAVFQKLDQDSTQNQYSCYVPGSTLTESATRYAHQLVTQGNLMEACQVALLIPENGLRARLTFDLLMRTAVTTEQTDIRVQSDVCDKLQLPERFRLVALALRLQSANQAGQAVDVWLRSGHVFWAEDLFRRLVLPAHLKRQVDLGSIKQLYFEQSLFSTNRTPVQHTQADKILSQMKEQARKTSYQQWSVTPCGLYQRVKLVQRGFCGENVHLQQQELTEISRLIPDHGTDPLTMWLKTEVHQMLVAITARLRIGVLATAPEIGDVSQAQAKRGCEQVMMKGLIDRMIPNLHGQSLQ